MRVRVPYYRQTSEFERGPAYALTVLQHFGVARTQSKPFEFELWRECNMIGVRGADPLELSVPLLAGGLAEKIITFNLRKYKRRGIIPKDRLGLIPSR